ncbi:MAG: type II toxin-antitoxin system VapC family toxin [Sediminibacterium sp.]|nr:type II toxin-antitoxin system VapC family toxin [Sediminibacterium sp.]
MADKIVLVDTSILIDLFRKTDKANATLVALVKQGYIYCISAITEYEIYTGATLGQISFWNTFLETTEVLAFDKTVAKVAVEINSDLKIKRKQIAIPDLFIAATAISSNLPFATLNRKHFDRIDGLNIIE